jgi:SOS-response transcriptional repressor LexA
MARRPHASEGSLRPDPAGWARTPGATAPFDAGGATGFLEVEDDRLAALDVRAGDRLVLRATEAAEHGDLALVEEDGRALLWRVQPEAGGLLLGDGRTRRPAAADARVRGVVLALLRRLQAPRS